MEFEILGALQVLAGGKPLALGGARQRGVLALLLVEAPAAVSVDRLIDELLGERPPATAWHAVQVYVSALRKLLRPGGTEVAVRKSAGGYVLDVDPERVDARRFEGLVEQGQHVFSGDPWRGRALFEQALALWRGRPLSDLSRFGFARREADRLEESYATAVEGVVEARLMGGEHGEVIPAVTRLVAADPLRERPRQLLMLALYRGGRHAEALGAYRDACAALDEVGLQPGPELRRLEQAILRHDAALAAPSAEAAASLRPADRGGGESREPARRARKMVTTLFLDVMSLGTSGESSDLEAVDIAMRRCFGEVRQTIEAHGGRVERLGVDAVLSLFGVERAHEDDALRAVRAAHEIRERLPPVAAEVGAALGFRAALDTGLVLTGEGEDPTLGEPVTVAARMLRAAPPGEILLGDETLRLVRDAVEVEPFGPVALKGEGEPVPAFRLLRVDPLAGGHVPRLDVPLVGRERELGMLRAAWERAVAEAGCHLFTLLGVAGIGKSRLVAELLATVGGAATVLRGRCLRYGEGITFWPLFEALTPVGERARVVLERVESGSLANPQELCFEVRRMLESLAGEQPVLLHIDDLQWAQPMLLKLLDHVVELSRGAPILVLCSARTELLEEHPSWGTGKLNATAALLGPLAPSDCEALLEWLDNGLDDNLRAHVIAVSEGNPLVLEEIAALAGERGTVGRPATIHALLQARLEGIPVAERELLELGAVEGEVFHRRAVRALAAEGSARDADSCLDELVRKELIRSHPTMVNDDEAFRFRHALIRDVAYDRLTKDARARLHERFAGWLEDNARELAELDEIAGWHLEEAIRYQRELSYGVAPGLITRAVAHLHNAGRRAAHRSDTMAARTLLERARSLARPMDPITVRIGLDLAEALLEGGDLDRLDRLLSAAETDPATAPRASLIRLQWLTLARPAEAVQKMDAALPETVERLTRVGDEHGLARAHLAGFWAKSQGAARVAEAGEQARLAAVHARNAGDDGLRSRALGLYVVTLCYGPQDATTIEHELDAIEQEQAGPYVEALIAIARGEVERLNGRLEDCRRLMRSGIEQLHAMGIHTIPGSGQCYLAWGELSGGDPASALPGLLRADATLASLGERGFRSTVQATLAQIYERLGEIQQARKAVKLADELTAPVDALTVTLAATAHARLALVDDDPDAAESWAQHGVEHAFKTDIPFLQGWAQLELGRVLGSLYRRQHAGSAIRAALTLFEAKGDQPRALYARALLTELDDEPTCSRVGRQQW